MVLTRQGERFTGRLGCKHFSQVLCIPERESAGGWAGDEKRGEKKGVMETASQRDQKLAFTLNLSDQ